VFPVYFTASSRCLSGDLYGCRGKLTTQSVPSIKGSKDFSTVSSTQPTSTDNFVYRLPFSTPYTHLTMAPNQRIVVSGGGRPQKGFVGTLYDEITSSENATIVRSLLVFGVSISVLNCCSEAIVEWVLIRLFYRPVSLSSTAASASCLSLRKSTDLPLRSFSSIHS